MIIVPFESQWIPKVKIFVDQVIGNNYFTEIELQEKQEQSRKDGQTPSLVITNGENILGLRLTFPHGQWIKGKGDGLSPGKWPFGIEETAYFQSLYIDPSLMGQGWGRKLSLMSIEILKQIGSKGVVCHSWLESPGDSSGRYLRALNFQSICQYPEYWKPVDYDCPRCGKPCVCTAEEMYLDISKETD